MGGWVRASAPSGGGSALLQSHSQESMVAASGGEFATSLPSTCQGEVQTDLGGYPGPHHKKSNVFLRELENLPKVSEITFCSIL